MRLYVLQTNFSNEIFRAPISIHLHASAKFLVSKFLITGVTKPCENTIRNKGNLFSCLGLLYQNRLIQYTYIYATHVYIYVQIYIYIYIYNIYKQTKTDKYIIYIYIYLLCFLVWLLGILVCPLLGCPVGLIGSRVIGSVGLVHPKEYPYLLVNG